MTVKPTDRFPASARFHQGDHVDLDGFKPGDRVRWRRANGTMVTDTVRDTFMQFLLLEPYGENLFYPALTLTQYSWMPACQCERI